MATSFKASFLSQLTWDYTIDDGSLRVVRDTNSIGNVPEDITDSAGVSHVAFHERRTLAAGGSFLYDLAGGLIDHFGVLRTFTSVKAMFIRNLSTSLTSPLTIGGGSNDFASWFGTSGDTVVIEAGGTLAINSPLKPYTVVAGTGDMLKAFASNGAVTFDIALIGIL